MADVKPIPDNYPQLVPYLCVDGASAAIDFYRTVAGPPPGPAGLPFGQGEWHE